VALCGSGKCRIDALSRPSICEIGGFSPTAAIRPARPGPWGLPQQGRHLAPATDPTDPMGSRRPARQAASPLPSLARQPRPPWRVVRLIPDLDNKDPFDGGKRASRAHEARSANRAAARSVLRDPRVPDGGQASERTREALLPHRRPRSFVRWLRFGPLVVLAPRPPVIVPCPRLTSGERPSGQMGPYYRDLVLDEAESARATKRTPPESAFLL
jgi:hypothetical protein